MKEEKINASSISAKNYFMENGFCHPNCRCVILKSRQMGATTFWEGAQKFRALVNEELERRKQEKLKTKFRLIRL